MSQVAVITGAASGIGAGLARKAHALGMRLVLADVSVEALQALARETNALAVLTDVASAESVEKLAERAYAKYGQVDFLFNNAGVMAAGNSWEIEAQRWRRTVDINLFGVLHGIRSFVPRMLAAKRPARIINTSSVGGFMASPLMSPYSATKFAVVALTESLRAEMELLGAPVSVSLLAPGPVKTGIFRDPCGPEASDAARGFVAQLVQMTDQLGISPEELAERAFAGIVENRFWLIPQPEALDEGLRARTDGILARATPKLLWATQ
jgi:NAD(P)-dependent dehydrogenase (short-subunit alcohol dehydrogenase family)